MFPSGSSFALPLPANTDRPPRRSALPAERRGPFRRTDCCQGGVIPSSLRLDLRDLDVLGPLGALFAVLLGALRQIELARRERELVGQALVDAVEKIASLISLFSRCLISSGTAFGTAIARNPVLTKPG